MVMSLSECGTILGTESCENHQTATQYIGQLYTFLAPLLDEAHTSENIPYFMERIDCRLH